MRKVAQQHDYRKLILSWTAANRVLGHKQTQVCIRWLNAVWIVSGRVVVVHSPRASHGVVSSTRRLARTTEQVGIYPAHESLVLVDDLEFPHVFVPHLAGLESSRTQ